MRLEVSTCPRRIDGHLSKLGVRHAIVWRSFDSIEQPAHPVRRSTIGVQRATPLAGPIAGEQGVTASPIVFHIAGQRFSRRARRPAEDAGRAHGDHEDAVVRGIPPLDGVIHFPIRWPLPAGGADRIHLLLPRNLQESLRAGRCGRHRFLSAEFKSPKPHRTHEKARSRPAPGFGASHRREMVVRESVSIVGVIHRRRSSTERFRSILPLLHPGAAQHNEADQPPQPPANALAARLAHSSGETSSMCVATDQLWPNGSSSLP